MRIVIVDDHPVVRQGVQQTLSMQEDMQVVGVAGSCSEGVDVIVSLKPDVAILDMKIPGCDDGFSRCVLPLRSYRAYFLDRLVRPGNDNATSC
jgi:DNA-binding NarL/FixJ family response regulator